MKYISEKTKGFLARTSYVLVLYGSIMTTQLFWGPTESNALNILEYSGPVSLVVGLILWFLTREQEVGQRWMLVRKWSLLPLILVVAFAIIIFLLYFLSSLFYKGPI